MDYIERLIRRACAVPREQAMGLFDPFDQVSPWALDVPASAQTGSLVKVGKHAEQPASLSRVIKPLQQGLQQALRLLAERPGQSPSAKQPASLLAKPEPQAEDKAEQKPRVQPVQVRDYSSLARADAFMNSLGVKPTAPETSVHMHAALDHNVEEVAIAPTSATVREAASRTPSIPVVVRPVPPSFRVPAVHTAAQRSVRASPPMQEESSHPQSRRTAPHPVPERIVQTTVVVASTSHRLDDLAHSSSISRFGIGQL